MPFALLLAALSAPASAAVYRCAVDGVVQYRDTPCHGGDVPVAVPDANVVQPQQASPLAAQHDARVQAYQKARVEEDAAWRQRHDADAERQARIRAARVHGEAAIGMTAADLRAALGEPQKIAAHRSGKGQRETWTYRDNDGSRTTVTMQDGVVSNVSSSRTKNSRSRR